MNRISRILMMSGLGIATSLSLGMVPAQAAPSTSQSTVTNVNRDRDDDDWEFKRYYEDRDDCQDAGRRGERREWWENYYCKRVRWHGERYYALWVQEDDDDHDDRRWRD